MEEIIVEASRTRFWNHLARQGRLAIISPSTAAMKKLLPKECRREEARASALLANAIDTLGYGYIPLRGGYTYPPKSPTSPSSEEAGQSPEFDVEVALLTALAAAAQKESNEPSYAIPEITLDQALDLGARFGQVEIFYKAADFKAGYYDCETRRMTMPFDFSPYLSNDPKADWSRKNMRFDPERVKNGWSQLARGTHVGRVKFGFPVKESGPRFQLERLYEGDIPTRGEALIGIGSKWVRIL